jgi:glycine C-acetyltransferase
VSDLHLGRDFSRSDSLALGTVLDRRGVPALADADQILAARLAAVLAQPAVTLFRFGNDAILAGLRHLFRAGDTVLADVGNQAIVAGAARSARARVCLVPAGSTEAVERRLTRLRATRTKGGLWVVVPAISANASVMSDLADLAELCQAFRARLVVDVSQDLGALGQDGGGVQELQGCIGRADVVLGSFAPTFVSSGSFLALRDPDLAQPPALPASPMPHGNAGRLLVAMGLILGPEGRHRRRALHGAVLRLRNQLLAEGAPVMGHPSPFVVVRLSPDQTKRQSDLARAAGFSIPLLQAPLVAGRAPRWRIQLTAAHGLADIDDLAGLVIDLCRLRLGRRIPDRVDALTQGSDLSLAP